MKVRAQRAVLAEAIAWAAQVLPKKAAIPAMAGVHLTAADDVLTIEAFDYETSRTVRVSCDVEVEGQCLAPGRLVAEIIGGLKGADVEVVLEGARVAVLCGRAQYRVGAMAVGDYPRLPSLPKRIGAIHRDSLASLLGAIEHAAGRDDMVPILTAIHLAGDDEVLEAITTDRFRVANAQVGWSGAEFSANIPAAALTNALKGMAGDLELGNEDGLFGISDGNRSLTTRSLDGDFPRVEKFLSIEPTTTVEVEAELLAGALRRADAVNERKEPLRLLVSSDEIEVTTDGESGDGAEFIECKATAQIDVLFSGTYLSTALLAAGAERVQLGFTGPMQPVTVTPLDDRPVRMVVMPRRSVTR